jgi:hypothetical protein
MRDSSHQRGTERAHQRDQGEVSSKRAACFSSSASISLGAENFNTRKDFTIRLIFSGRKDFTIRLIFSNRKDFTIRLIFSNRKDFTIRLIFSGRKDFTIRLIFTGRKYLYIFPVFYFSAFLLSMRQYLIGSIISGL